MNLYCCNLSGGVALIVWFTTNRMCVKNKTIYMWREQAIIEWSRWSDLGEWLLTLLVNLVNSWLYALTVTTRVISSGDLYCCLLPQCEALRTCRSGFPIATVPRSSSQFQKGWWSWFTVIRLQSPGQLPPKITILWNQGAGVNSGLILHFSFESESGLGVKDF